MCYFTQTYRHGYIRQSGCSLVIRSYNSVDNQTVGKVLDIN